MTVPPPLYDDLVPLSRRKRVARFVITLVIVAAAGTTGLWWWNNSDGATEPIGTAFAAQTDTLARAPKGVRVRVRVVNATEINGLAKRATAVLRDRGFDVVDYEGAKMKTPRATTLVQTHTGHDDWGNRVARVLGTGIIQSSPDTSRYVDVTVTLGLDWKAPAQAFRP
ncbi:MAG: LytR C-terminal domain-containing protein [Gemmatimonas sp.]